MLDGEHTANIFPANRQSSRPRRGWSAGRRRRGYSLCTQIVLCWSILCRRRRSIADVCRI